MTSEDTTKRIATATGSSMLGVALSDPMLGSMVGALLGSLATVIMMEPARAVMNRILARFHANTEYKKERIKAIQSWDDGLRERREETIEYILYRVLCLLKNQEIVTPVPDPERMCRMLSWARDAMSNDTRELWARALAGQFCSKGATSLRTIDIIQKLDRDDARLVSKACRYIVDGRFLMDLPPYNNSAFLRQHNIVEPYHEDDSLRRNELTALASMGVCTDMNLFSGLRLRLPKRKGEGQIIITHPHEYVAVAGADHKVTPVFKRFELTREGIELAAVCGIDHDKGIVGLARHIPKHGFWLMQYVNDVYIDILTDTPTSGITMRHT